MLRAWALGCLIVCGAALGCGTTRMSDSARTATEQMLVSDAMDQAISNLDLHALSGRTIYLETAFLRSTVDCEYLISSFRQHALANGCILKTKADEAEYVVELRSGAVGTDRHDVLYGVPAMSVPTAGVTGASAALVPEIPFVKKTDQRAVAKLAVFAYHRATGRPVWQSGIAPVESTSKALWVLGAGPFRQGSIYNGTRFAGDKVRIPLVEPGAPAENSTQRLSVANEAFFAQPLEATELARRDPPAVTSGPPASAAHPTNPIGSLLPPLAGSPAAAANSSPLLPHGASHAAPFVSPSGPTVSGANTALPSQTNGGNMGSIAPWLDSWR